VTLDISTLFDPTLTWLSDRLASLLTLPPIYIGLAATIPLLIALIMRDLLMALVTGLFAVGLILLCATREFSWPLLATFEATAAFWLAFAVTIRQRRSQAPHKQKLSSFGEIDALKERLNVLETCERRRIMESLHSAPRNLMDTTGLLAPAEDALDSKTKFPIAPK